MFDSLYPGVQNKLRAEILAVPEHLDHDALVALPYLDAVIHKSLRLYPPVVPTLFREAFEVTILSLRTPIIGVDGTPMHALNVPKGTSTYIAARAVGEREGGGRHDKAVWDLRSTMTFLGGGRGCIGFKFSQLEIMMSRHNPTKVVLCVLLHGFKSSKPDPRIKWRMTGVIPAPHFDNHARLPSA
ncbi:cytochrome P450 [Mycena vulgaris]|nr:cytochrome P450 [Mycena vulgaris]